MTDLSTEELRERIRALEEQVYPESMSNPEEMPLGSADDPADPIHTEFVRLKEQAEDPGGEAGLRGLFVDSNGILKKVDQDGTTGTVSGAPSSAEFVLASSDADIPNARTLSTSGAVSIIDNGSGNDVVVEVDGSQIRLSQEEVEDIVGAMAAGVLLYDDANGQLDVPEESIEDIVGAMAGDSIEYDDANANLDVAVSSGPNPFDSAESFTESDVSIGPFPGETDQIDRGSDSGNKKDMGGSEGGGYITPSKSAGGVMVTVSSLTHGDFEARLEDTSTSTVLDTVSKTGVSEGDKFKLAGNMDAGTEYLIALSDTRGDSSGGYLDIGGSFGGTDFNITDGYYQGFRSSRVQCWRFVELSENHRFRGEVSNGSLELGGVDEATAFIEWSQPTDIFDWDVATFTKTEDGETVNVYAAYSNDGGSTWERLNGGNPISRNFSLAAEQDNVAGFDADSEVRIEAELSRSDTANNPTLDSAYRSWLV